MIVTVINDRASFLTITDPGLAVTVDAVRHRVVTNAGPPGPQGPAGPAGPAGEGVPVGGTSGQVLSKVSSTDYDTEWSDLPEVEPVSWGDIGGDVADQTDLGEAATLDVGTTAGTVAAGDHDHDGVYEPADATILKAADIGVNVQAYDADLTALGDLAKSDGNFIVGNGTTWVAESGSTARSSLGLGSAATEDSSAFATAAQGMLADSAVQPAAITDMVEGDGITDIVALTQTEYDGLTPDATTLYVIVPA